MPEGGEGNGYEIQLENGHGAGMVFTRPIFKSNPATNDWIPNVDEDDQVFMQALSVNENNEKKKKGVIGSTIVLFCSVQRSQDSFLVDQVFVSSKPNRSEGQIHTDGPTLLKKLVLNFRPVTL